MPRVFSSGCLSNDAISRLVSPFAPSPNIAKIDENPSGENTKLL